ncbi:protein GVQW3 [Trichonephila clavipes]|uniref:Protein GVQW3 n=1 Tax=Trichonephila clavipes TaxID=2585209 RepID=A0A8X6S7B4_TRICX|nr:protein GVQW3 [Trichonephila clavipes]
MEKRAVIKFYAKLGKSASEAYQLMKQVYGDCCLRSNVFVLHSHFLDGRDAVEDDQRSGRPISSRTPEIIEKVLNFVANDSLRINKETIRTILHEGLGKTKVCAKFVLHTLFPEQKPMRNVHYKKQHFSL